ncbi:MAG: B12-binding domain-containing radical SAM protein [Deltaproteobacteria bacterium]|nr:B12-binding domain-containing radical SAM protein [Deltaproteobacteria bacterium]
MSNFTNKILFVIVDNYKTERPGVQILSSIALQEGYERDILIINSLSVEANLKRVLDFKPQIVAYSGMTYEHTILQEFNRLLKTQSGISFLSIFGGPHYTFNPEEIFNDNGIDIVCRGEGEVAFRSFIQALRDNLEYRRIDKLWVRDGDEVIKNPIGLLIHDMDTVPFMDRDLIPLDDLATDHFQGKSLLCMIGRGCPHKCTYCFNLEYNTLFGDSRIYRHRSVDNIIEELKQLVKRFDLDIFLFLDDCFSYLPRTFIEEFSRRYKEEINKPFSAQFRPELVREDTIVMLKDAGLYLVPIGVECGNETVANNILQRGRITNQHIINAFDMLHKHKLKTWSLNLLALPVEDPLSIDIETIKLNMRLKPYWAQFNILVPIPKTPIWDYIVKNGYIDEKSYLKFDKLPSGFTETKLVFKNRRVADRVTNLHKFAGIVVKFPFLLPLVRALILLPPNRIYQYIFFLWYGYWKTIGTYNAPFSFKLIVNGLRAIRQYLKRH